MSKGMSDLRWAYRVMRVHDGAGAKVAKLEWDAIIAAHDRQVQAEARRKMDNELRRLAVGQRIIEGTSYITVVSLIDLLNRIESEEA